MPGSAALATSMLGAHAATVYASTAHAYWASLVCWPARSPFEQQHAPPHLCCRRDHTGQDSVVVVAGILHCDREQRAMWAGLWRTYADGEGCQVHEPEQDQAALEAHAVENDAGEGQRAGNGDDELVQHLGAQVGDHPVQPVVPLPA